MKTFIIGHKNPDTDSIASSMAYCDLKQQLGEDVEARRLGPLNEETKYATRVFGVDAPDIMMDGRCRIRDIEIDTAYRLNPEDSCNIAFANINNSRTRTMFVCVDDVLKGIVSLSDLSSIRMRSKDERQQLLSQSNIECITRDIRGTVLYSSGRFETNGKVKVYGNQHEKYKDTITLCENGTDLLNCLLEKPTMVIFTGKDIKEKIVEAYRENDVTLISTQMDLEDIIRLIFEAVPVSLIMSEKMVTYNENEFVEDIASKIIRTRYRTYPVVDDEGKLKGAISRYHLFNYERKKFILVDHSSKTQSINYIDEAEVVEIIDHHHIGNIETSKPIFYRNQTLGCTCSIIYEMYIENGLIPPKHIAGMMLSAIISDTLNFMSRTTTQKDREYAAALAEIAGVDLNRYAIELISSSINLKDANVSELIVRDLKNYTFYDYSVAVAQTNYNRLEEVHERMADFKQALDQYQQSSGLDLLIMMFTNVNGDGSFFMFTGPKADVMSEVIDVIYDDCTGFDKDIISRKQQLVPVLDHILQQY